MELAGIEDRIVRLTPFSGNLRGYTLDKKGEHLYYSMSYGAAYDIWQLNLRSRENKVLHKGQGGALAWDERMETLFSFGRGMKKFKNGTGAAETVQPSGVLQLDRRAKRAYMFDRICHQERERFYEESMHGVEWGHVPELRTFPAVYRQRLRFRRDDQRIAWGTERFLCGL